MYVKTIFRLPWIFSLNKIFIQVDPDDDSCPKASINIAHKLFPSNFLGATLGENQLRFSPMWDSDWFSPAVAASDFTEMLQRVS